MASITDYQITFFAKALGLSESEAAKYSINDLRYMYYRDYDPAENDVPGGGTEGQVLIKQSAADGDFNWGTVSGEGLVLDTSAGTRVMFGGVDIFYDSGWRTVIEWDDSGAVTYGSLRPNMVPLSDHSGFVRYRRRGDTTTLAFAGFEATGVVTLTPPAGFRRLEWDRLYLMAGSGAQVNYSDAIYLPSGEYSRMELVGWECPSGKPATLPGTPV